MSIIFTQCLAFLCSAPPDLTALRLRLEQLGHTIRKVTDEITWKEMEGLSLTIPYSGDVDCNIDITDETWPDTANTEREGLQIVGAAGMGAYGPGFSLGGLQRALKSVQDENLNQLVSQHRAFIRFRLHGELFQKEGTGPRDPKVEMLWLLNLAASLSDLPEILLYYNPSAELLLLPEHLRSTLEANAEAQLYPVESFTKSRKWRVNDTWRVAESMGMIQLDLPDHEFVVSDNFIKDRALSEFIRGLCKYQLRENVVFGNRHTTDGPGEQVWIAEVREKSIVEPDRNVIHWRPRNPDPTIIVPEELNATAPALAETTNETSLTETDLHAQVYREMAKTIADTLADRKYIRQRVQNWLRSEAFYKDYYEVAHLPKSILVSAVSMVVTAAKRAYGIQGNELWKQYQELAEHGEVWLALPIIVNPAFNREPDKSVPCSLLLSHEQIPEGIMYAGLIAARIGSIYQQPTAPADAKILHKLIKDDQSQLFRRRPLPVEETGGCEATLLDVLLKKSWMPPEDVPFIPLFALPGAKGPIVQIPWAILKGTPLPRLAAAPPPLPPSPPPGRPGPVQPVSKHRNGCGQAIMNRIFFVLIVGLIGLLLPERCLKDKKSQPPKEDQMIDTVGSPPAVEEASSAELLKKFTPVAPADYTPLANGTNRGLGFIFNADGKIMLAATNKHQLKSPRMLPRYLQGRTLTKIELSSSTLYRQPQSNIQLVRQTTDATKCLTYRSTEMITNGDRIGILLEDRMIEGKLTLPADVPQFPLSAPPRVLSLTLESAGNLTLATGAPVVNLEAGTVIGVLMPANPPLNPATVEFETLSIHPK